MIGTEAEVARDVIGRLPVLGQVWLLGGRVRVRRITENQWKVIPHDAWGRGDPLRFPPVKSVQDAVKLVVRVSGEIEDKRI